MVYALRQRAMHPLAAVFQLSRRRMVSRDIPYADAGCGARSLLSDSPFMSEPNIATN